VAARVVGEAQRQQTEQVLRISVQYWAHGEASGLTPVQCILPLVNDGVAPTTAIARLRGLMETPARIERAPLGILGFDFELDTPHSRELCQASFEKSTPQSFALSRRRHIEAVDRQYLGAAQRRGGCARDHSVDNGDQERVCFAANFM